MNFIRPYADQRSWAEKQDMCPALFPPGGPQLPGPALLSKGKEMGMLSGLRASLKESVAPSSHLAPGGEFSVRQSSGLRSLHTWELPSLDPGSFQSPGLSAPRAPHVPVASPTPDPLHPPPPGILISLVCREGAWSRAKAVIGSAAGSPAAWTEVGTFLGPGRCSDVQHSPLCSHVIMEGFVFLFCFFGFF